MHKMVNDRLFARGYVESWNGGNMTVAMVSKLRSMFDKLRGVETETAGLSRDAVDKWLVKIYGVLGRGSEY